MNKKYLLEDTDMVILQSRMETLELYTNEDKLRNSISSMKAWISFLIKEREHDNDN